MDATRTLLAAIAALLIAVAWLLWRVLLAVGPPDIGAAALLFG